MNWTAIRTWGAIVLLLDAACGLWMHESWQVRLPKINIASIALIEALTALVLLTLNHLF